MPSRRSLLRALAGEERTWQSQLQVPPAASSVCISLK
jgi:hypothetical protein